MPIPSMFGIFSMFMVNVGKKDIHGWFGMGTHNLHF